MDENGRAAIKYTIKSGQAVPKGKFHTVDARMRARRLTLAIKLSVPVGKIRIILLGILIWRKDG
jgi:hypothetical protein